MAILDTTHLDSPTVPRGRLLRAGTPLRAAYVLFLSAPRVARGVAGGRRARAVAGFTTLVGLALIGAWGGFSVRFAVNGTLPQDVMPPPAIHLVYALDLGVLAPAFVIAGVLLWLRKPWGAVLAVAVNASGAAYLTVLEFVGGFQANAGIDGKTWSSPTAIVAVLLCLSAVGVLLLPPRTTLTEEASHGSGSP